MKTVRIGQLGLGRLGYEHARNLATAVPGASLDAVCHIHEDRLVQVADELGIENRFTDFAQMCADPELDAIVIVSPSIFHTEHIRMALEAGKHVFCEKPLDTTVEKCKEAEALVAAHPDQIFMLGFMRRFDRSYQKAMEKIRRGDIGRVSMVRSYTADPFSTIEGTLKFAPKSGGQFLDMCVHDIDLIRWFTGSDPKRVWAIGDTFEFTQMKEWNDTDQSCAMMQCENGAMAFIYASRVAKNGSNVETEIIGTRGQLRIGAVGTDTMMEVFTDEGILRETYADWVLRWHDAYIAEMAEFVNCILEGRKPEITAHDGTCASTVAYACRDSYESGKLLEICY